MSVNQLDHGEEHKEKAEVLKSRNEMKLTLLTHEDSENNKIFTQFTTVAITQ